MGEILNLVENSKAINSNLFSRQRILILKSLESLDQEGAVFRQLKAFLELDDGSLASSLKMLEEIGFIKSKKIKLENKNMTQYFITNHGKEEFNIFKKWLGEVIE
ncbi:MAG: transcriptional regulator [Candidatus Micrarchaeia archaeon]|jgi:DNA-binding HxlR family transcriptional regulator